MKSCENCPDRDSCTEICSDIEGYVNQDYVGIKEFIPRRQVVPYVSNEDLENADQGEKKPVGLTETEKKILRCVWNGKTPKQTAKHLGITEQNVYQVRHILRKKGQKNSRENT